MILDDFVPEPPWLGVAAGEGAHAEALWSALRTARAAGAIFKPRALGTGLDAVRRGFFGGVSSFDRSEMASCDLMLLGPDSPPPPPAPLCWRYPVEALAAALSAPVMPFAPALRLYSEGAVMAFDARPGAESGVRAAPPDSVLLMLACAACASYVGAGSAAETIHGAVLRALEEGACGYWSYVPGGKRRLTEPAVFFAEVSSLFGMRPIGLPVPALPPASTAARRGLPTAPSWPEE